VRRISRRQTWIGGNALQLNVGGAVRGDCNRVIQIIWAFFFLRICMFDLVSTVRSPIVAAIWFLIGYGVQDENTA